MAMYRARRLVALAGVSSVMAVVALHTWPAAAPAAGNERMLRPIALGVLGDPARFQAQTDQRSTIRHTIISWNQGVEWGTRLPALLAQMRPVPMLGIGTSDWRSKREVVTPLDIARGKGDAFLVALNGAIAEFGGLVYLRPLPEMNNHHRPFSAFDRSGRARGPSHSTRAFRNAFARIAVLARGGAATAMNAQLRALGLPEVGGDLPATQVRIVWNPQGYGSPNIRQNAAHAYYPGDAYVDVVANDLYDQGFKAAWEANERLYAAHPGKAFAIGEWGLWGIDDPAFVQRMAAFVRTHPRVEFVAYFSGPPRSPWDLASKPRSRAAYRRAITPLGG
jgi:hypothetical protein